MTDHDGLHSNEETTCPWEKNHNICQYTKVVFPSPSSFHLPRMPLNTCSLFSVCLDYTLSQRRQPHAKANSSHGQEVLKSVYPSHSISMPCPCTQPTKPRTNCRDLCPLPSFSPPPPPPLLYIVAIHRLSFSFGNQIQYDNT